MQHAPDAEIDLELAPVRVDLELVPRAGARLEADAAQERSQPVDVRRIVEEHQQGEGPFARS
jgi:hypothetical protein